MYVCKSIALLQCVLVRAWVCRACTITTAPPPLRVHVKAYRLLLCFVLFQNRLKQRDVAEPHQLPRGILSGARV